MSVVTRFAPSPTGFLHIGGARTALFNWLYARHMGGQFLLRIEDTDRERSVPEAITAIFQGLAWLGLTWDDEPVFQFSRAERHQHVAYELLNKGLAYRCYATPEDLTLMREEARRDGRPPLYDGRWRDRDPGDAPQGIPSVIRLKAPQEGQTHLRDQVQGDITVQNGQLDDMILLRSDGTPTYMLSVVVDDHDMHITHVVRGDDHLTNTFRQLQIYQAMGWAAPEFAHIPLIHGPDGAKLSKRHGALGVEAYKDMGILPEALRNYLLRLGWGHGDDEIISTAQAIEWFTLEAVGRAPSRFDSAKLLAINAHYLREASDSVLLEGFEGADAATQERLRQGLPGLKTRAKTLVELQEGALIYASQRPPFTEEARALLASGPVRDILEAYRLMLEDAESWSQDTLESCARHCAASRELKLGQLAQPLRAALTGRTVSPPIFEVAEILGKQLVLERLGSVEPVA